MKILIDTNIMLEIILQREEFAVANHLLTALSDGNHKVFMTIGGFYEFQFLLHRSL